LRLREDIALAADLGHSIVALLPRLRAFGRALTRSQSDADDLVQAACERALRSADSFVPGTRLDSWMFRIMQNAWIDERRRYRPTVQLEAATSAAVGDDGRRSFDAKLSAQAALAIIDQLPAEHRDVVVLVCVEDLPYREAADVLGVPIGTVMSRLARARQAIAAAMHDGSQPATGFGS
jgi:RNA polymerase sigma-70 factor (ECF subfamily)